MTKLSSYTIITSILATSIATLSSSNFNSSLQELRGRKCLETGLNDEFAPRFDGLSLHIV
ncbi:hypothetical protein M8C21_025939 [Ambrosia artemisiifolia]|uniref:Uncharacterized protein n=1 Tax=Ambrosia artemisiifolia TaxID=4212 RepID=A0AAD5D2N8_AMBAR|nr:hypothetical protein M8C21_025939 [Ambrosia artemisiifolia]